MSDTRDKSRRAAAVRTFLIADIRGYTRFTAQHGDEPASRLASKFAELASEGVEAWGGELVELRGDEALAVFDSPRQALRSAIELQDAFQHETDDEPELPLSVGIGVDAGEAVAVGDGYRGAALNRAARLCGAAAGGEIIASADLVHLTGPMEGITFQARPDMELKGIEAPTAAMGVSDSKPCSRKPGGLAQAEQASVLPVELEAIVPLAGRQSELRWLRWHWRRARHGDGRIVVLSGPRGIGRTRLSAELAAIAHGSGGAVNYVSGAKGGDAGDLPSLDRGQPQLIVIDDLELASTPLRAAAIDMAAGADETPALVVVTHGDDMAPTLLSAVERLAPPERRLLLGPLDAEAVRAIAALYADHKVEELPLPDLREQSGGVPADIHRLAAQLASSMAARRLGASAEQTEAGRRDLRQAEEALIGDLTDLELVRGRARRYEGSGRAEPAKAAICPFKGLATFEAVDAEYYFGRERLIAELLARLVGSRFLGLVGASGSGKSSVLRAGLMPAIASGFLPGSDDWLQVLTRPGEHPLTELAQAMDRAGAAANLWSAPQGVLSAALDHLAPGRQLLLIVDQFEELFTATQDEEERQAFVDLLTSDRPGVVVVAVLRADHYGHCAQYPALARLMGASHVLVGPLTALELASVIEGPAQRVGLRVESALVEELTVDAGSEPSVLPLLSTSLLELWQAREGGWLTLAAYRQGGGLRGSVARLAETAFGKLDSGQAAIARSVFLRLAGVSEAEGAVRRRVPLAELDVDTNPLVGNVVDALTSARLLTIGDGYVEVAHEALLREWPRLQSWLDEDAAGRALRLHLIGSVREWQQGGRESGDLYRGARLSAALDWAAERDLELNSAERKFLDESRLASERDVEKQRSANRRLRGLLAGAAGLLVVAVVAGGIALTQANAARQRETEAGSARGEAEAAARFARSRELAAASLSVIAEDPTLSKLLAVSAASLVPPDLEIESALHRAWSADMVVGRYDVPEDEALDGLGTDIDPEGELMVGTGGNFGGQPGGLLVVDLATHHAKWRYEPESAPASVVAGAYFSIDGTSVIAGVSWTPDEEDNEPQPPPEGSVGVLIWDAQTGRLLKRLDTGGCGAHILAVSATVALISTPSPADPEAAANCSTTDGDIAVETVDLTSGVVTTLSAHTSGDGALSRDGTYAAFDLDDGHAVIVDLATSERVLEIDPLAMTQQRDSYVRSLSADGSLLLYGDRPILVIGVATGDLVATLAAGEGESIGTAFAPEGSTAYAAGSDATLRAWDALSGEPLFIAPAAGGGRPSAALDGRVLVSDFATDTATLLDPGSRGELGTFRGCNGFVPAGTLEVAGDIAAFTTYCDVEGIYPTYVASLPDLAQLATVPDANGQDLALSPDGKRFARQSGVGDMIGTVEIHDAGSGDLIVEMEGLCAWDTSYVDRHEGGPQCEDFPGTPFTLYNVALAFSPDGRFLAAVDDEFGYGAVWDAATGRLQWAMAGIGQAYAITFTPDSAELIASNLDGELIAVSTESWEVTLRVTLDASINGAGRIGFAGFLDDGTLIGLSGFGGTGGGWLHRIDVSTLSVLSTVRAHDGAPKSMAVNPDGTLVVTGGADGVVRVWDGASGSLLHEFTVDGQAQGVAFVGEDRVAVTPQAGPLMIMAIDRQDLLSSVRSTLTRGFTAEECERFNFGAECPTIEELRGEAP